MAAGLGFKDFVTGEVLTAADVDGYLMQGVWVFASAAARDAAVTSPQEGNFAYLKDTNVTTYYTGSAWANLDTTGMTNPMTTTGDTIYSSSGSTPARLGIGSTGQVLTVAGGVPSWATPAGGGGKVLQVVSTTKTDTFTTSSTTFVDITGFSVSITPSSATSKIMVFTSLQDSGLADSNSATTRLMRDSTAIFVGDAASSRGQSSADVRGGIGSNRVGSSQAPMTLDAPATTSALTYKVQIRTLTAGSCFVNRGSVDTDNADHTRTASSITVMEIGA
jgi:hypothetical protein